MQRHLGMIVEPVVHRLLRFGRDEAVGGRDMQHQRVGDGVLLAAASGRSRPRNSRRRHRRRCAPRSCRRAARPGSSRPRRPCRTPSGSRRIVDRRLDIADAQVLVELAHQAERCAGTRVRRRDRARCRARAARTGRARPRDSRPRPVVAFWRMPALTPKISWMTMIAARGFAGGPRDIGGKLPSPSRVEMLTVSLI